MRRMVGGSHSPPAHRFNLPQVIDKIEQLDFAGFLYRALGWRGPLPAPANSLVTVMGTSASQVLPADLELLQIAQNRQRDLLRVEKRLCDAPHVVRCHGFDALQQLVQGEELAEIHFLPREVRHPATRRFQTEHQRALDRKSTRLNSSHLGISYAVFCLKKKK